MTEEEKNLFQKSNNCWVCKKFINNDKEKVRDHCYVTGKFRGAAHESCNINFQLTKKVPVIFHNLRAYDSHLLFHELDQFDVKIKVVPNGLEKYIAFFSIKTQCLSDKDFKYLIEEFGSEYLELLKQKGAYPHEYMNSWKDLMKKNYLLKNIFLVP